MRLIFFNDPHYTVRPPECRTSDYPGVILDKLHEVARLAQRLKAKVVGCSGDWFHRKGKVTFREANDLLAVFQRWRDKGLDVIGILGNHDIAGHCLESLDNRAVGSLVHSGVLQLLDHRPYVERSDVGGVYVTGTSYYHGCDSSDEARLRTYSADSSWRNPEGTDHLTWIHVAHGTLLHRGEFFEDWTRARDLVRLLHDHGRLPDVIVCGHLHFHEGVQLYDRPDGRGQVAIARIGSLARTARDDLDRRPSVLLVAVKGKTFLCREVPVGSREASATPEGEDPRDQDDYVEGIRQFVQTLREGADTFALSDHSGLIRRVVDEKGYGEDVYELALKRVESRQ